MTSIFDLFKKIENKESSVSSPEYIAVGLGNPGAEYEKTRHNAGFFAIDSLTRSLGVECNKSKFNALTCFAEIGGKKILIMKPQTFMNCSGEAVGKAAGYYKIPVEKIIVFCDDINFDAGSMRIREKGSDAGQKGIRSITETLNSENFVRVRIGVGKKPHPDYDLKSWVLGKPSEEDLDSINECADCSRDICELFIIGKISEAMGKYNKRSKKA